MDLLAVGVATIDIVSSVERYPDEDSEVRALDQRTAPGGNAVNTLLRLSRLGHRCSWAGAVADDRESDWLMGQLKREGVETRFGERYPGTRTPLSCITLSRKSGSRTIVHHRRLPEFSGRAFERLGLEGFDWVHFEGRNVPDLVGMLTRAASVTGLTCSLEVEKQRPGIEALFPLPDLLLFSRAYARGRGFADAGAFLETVRAQAGDGAVLVCAWGEQGSWGMDRAGRVCHAPAVAPPQVVDTLGAGDVFNAGVIHALGAGEALPEALRFANRLAGEKCGYRGIVREAPDA
ncbi:MAG TPA: hypothetical protein ENK50_00255 [Sedimenticola sp.]|nr:hypothetical protein [Sedimenticola sp.]